MVKSNGRLEAVRQAYREALEAARLQPTPEAWAKLLAAGKDLSAAQEPRARGSGGRRMRRRATPTLQELEDEAPGREPPRDLEQLE